MTLNDPLDQILSTESSTQPNIGTYTQDLNGDQFRAFQRLQIFLNLTGGGFFLVSGRAGSGKTFLSARIIRYIEEELGWPVAVTAPTHKAVGVLGSFLGKGETFTTHAFLGMREEIDINGKIRFVTGKAMEVPAERFRFLIVDEASMVPDVIFDNIELLVKQRGYKVIFVGDKKQIPPVGFPNSLPFDIPTQRDLAFEVCELEKIVRQAEGNPIIELANEIRDATFKPNPIVKYESRVKGLTGASFYEYEQISTVLPDIFAMFESEEFKKSSDYIKVIAYTNARVNKYNQIIRKHLYGDVPKIIVGDKLISDAPILEGKKIIIKNNIDLEVLNVDIGSLTIGDQTIEYYACKVAVGKEEKNIKIIHEDSEKDFKGILDTQAMLAKGYQRGSFQAKSAWMDFYKLKQTFAEVKHSYSVTGHKSQGSTYDHAVVDMRNIMVNHKIEERNRILYTACTRPKHTLKIFY